MKNNPLYLPLVCHLPIMCVLLVAFGCFGPFAPELPETLAVHWGLSGQPDGVCAPRDASRILGLLVVGVFAALQLLEFSRNAKDSSSQDQAPKLTWVRYCVFASGLVLMTISSNAHAATCQDATLSWPALVMGLGACALVSVAVRRLKGSPDFGPGTSSLGLAKGEQAAWMQSIVSWPLIGISGGLGLISLLVGRGFEPSALWLAVLVVIVTSSLAWVRVHVGSRGVRVYYGLCPFALTRLDLSELRSARVEDLTPGLASGWGYRGSMFLFGEATLMLRSGESLSIQLSKDRIFRVTIDDAATAAALINDLCAHRDA